MVKAGDNNRTHLRKTTLVYVSSLCDDSTYKELMGVFGGSGHAVQKYHSLLVKGFLKESNMRVIAISSVPTSNNGKKLEKRRAFSKDRFKIIYLLNSSITVLRHFLSFLGTFWLVLFSPRHSIVMCDVLKISSSLGAQLAAKIRRLPQAGIVTDLPIHMEFSKNRFMLKVSNYVLKNQDAYIVLTKQLNEIANKRGKPFLVTEGHVDSEFYLDSSKRFQKENRDGKFRCMYAGGILKEYGLKTLVEAVLLMDEKEIDLHIYGAGNMAEELVKMVKDHKNIKYFGSKENSEILNAELSADLLINPRPAQQDFTAYSFPSKTLEYMLSGTPVLSTRLPGIPKEYEPYLYWIDNETAEGMAEKIGQIMRTPQADRKLKGENAREFVLNNKSNTIQAAKILSFLHSVFP